MTRLAPILAALLLSGCTTTYDVVDSDGKPFLTGLTYAQALELSSEIEANDGMASRMKRRLVSK